MLSQNPIIGIDFDNTIACYDQLFAEAAADIAGLERSPGQTKKEIRDHVRNLPQGEAKWQQMQAEVYGPRMLQAQIYPDLHRFLENCYRQDLTIYIVSHKSEFATLSTDGVNLRTQAVKWMVANRVLSSEGPGVRQDRIFFEDTRDDKIARISELGCTHFIDDLVEVLNHEDFPTTTEGIHFAPGNQSLTGHTFQTISSWHEIQSVLFND